jgi:hypothetical protein
MAGMFLLGIALGIIINWASKNVRRRLGIGSADERQLGTGEHEQGIPYAALSDLRQADPALYQAVQQAPAVPLADQPAELKPQTIQEVRNAASIDAARTALRNQVHNEDVAEIMIHLIRWAPAFRHLTEEKYQRSLRNHLQKSGLDGRFAEKKPIAWSFQTAEDPARVGYPDFIVGDPNGPDRRKVLVEIKADLYSTADADRALGQMLRYLFAWKKCGPAILVVAGDAPPEIRFLVRLYVDTWRERLQMPVTVYFKRDDVADPGKMALMPAASE